MISQQTFMTNLYEVAEKLFVCLYVSGSTVVLQPCVDFDG